MHKKPERSSVVPFGDFDWCTNKKCPKALTCGRSVLRLENLPPQVLWQTILAPDENGHCGFEHPYRSYARALVLPELKAMQDDVSEAIEIVRKMPDEDGRLDTVQSGLENVLERINYLLSGFDKEEKKEDKGKCAKKRK